MFSVYAVAHRQYDQGMDKPSTTSVTATQLPRLLEAQSLADAAHCKQTTVRRWFREGKLPGVRVGKRILFTEETALALLRGEFDTK